VDAQTYASNWDRIFGKAKEFKVTVPDPLPAQEETEPSDPVAGNQP
jgi:hypothetical protein